MLRHKISGEITVTQKIKTIETVHYIVKGTQRNGFLFHPPGIGLMLIKWVSEHCE